MLYHILSMNVMLHMLNEVYSSVGVWYKLLVRPPPKNILEIMSSESAFPAISQNNFVKVTMCKLPDDTQTCLKNWWIHAGIDVAVYTHFF
jgi:hypothetical protein